MRNYITLNSGGLHVADPYHVSIHTHRESVQPSVFYIIVQKKLNDVLVGELLVVINN